MIKTHTEQWILYSTCDEDSYSEIQALNINPKDRVLCVTGSGCRTLSLLSCNPKYLISVDYSPGQNYLLELKLAAIKNLSYDSLLEFLGVEETQERWKIFTCLENSLSQKAAAYFRANRWAIEEGVLFTGRHELFYKRFVIPGLNLFFGNSFDQLFQANTIEEQKKIYQNKIKNWVWEWLIKVGFSPFVIRYVLNDPKYDFEVTLDSVADYLIQRLDHTFSNHLARDNHWVCLMFRGKYLGKRCLPHFLLEENYHAIRAANTQIEIKSTNILDYIKQVPNESIDKYSLSDISSCMKEEHFNLLLHEIVRTSVSQGRLCYRNFLTQRLIPTELLGKMQQDKQIASVLEDKDLAFAYTFEIATIY